ncbi:MAG: polysaccharide deacetylase family protein [Granulosicoccus sp.]
MNSLLARFGNQFLRLLLRLCGVCLYRAGLARWIINASPRTRVVLYHSVENNQSSYTKGLGTCVSPDTFALHLDYYQRFYRVKSMCDYLAGLPEQPAAAYLLITFDDGYASFMEKALPLLEARDMRATMYLIGNAVRGRMVWVNRLNQALHDYPGETREVLSRYPGLARLNRRNIIHRIQRSFTPEQISTLIGHLEHTVPNLTSSNEKLFASPTDIHQMQRRGVEFGFHSNDHWNLGRCKDRELETTLSTQGIDALINSNTFAYPFGYFSKAAVGRLQRQGYKKLLTVGSGNKGHSRLHLDRVEVVERSFAQIFARLEVEEPIVQAVRHWFVKRRLQARHLMTGNEKRPI